MNQAKYRNPGENNLH